MSAAAMPGHAGPSDAREARADLRDLLTALVKVALVGPGSGATRWRAEAVAAQARACAAVDAVAALPLDDLWTAAVAQAERDPVVRRDETVNPTLPTTSPLRMDRLLAGPFDLEGAVQAIRDAASSG